jgi:predicted transcriptional regulator
MAKSDPITELTPEDIAFLEAVKAGKASLDQGRGIPYELVRPWLMSWGAEDELPPPECE